MNVNQFAVYQLKNIPENRQIRFRPYHTLLEKGHKVQYKDYEQVYIGRMQPEDAPEHIYKRFEKQLPRTFHGHSISVSDILVLNKDGIITSYYVEKNGFTIIAGFIQNASSGTLVSNDTMNFHMEGKNGNGVAFDNIIIDGKEFFLMEHETYGKEMAWVVVDETGKLIVDNASQGFESMVKQQIRDYLNLSQPITDPLIQKKPSLEDWQKYMENGEYLRNSEIEEEQNYNKMHGRRNNMGSKGNTGRASVLAKLHQKQAEIAKRSEKSTQQMELTMDMEHRRK